MLTDNLDILLINIPISGLQYPPAGTSQLKGSVVDAGFTCNFDANELAGCISQCFSSIEDNKKFLTIYDPTCGGGNMLYGVEDKINEKYNRPTSTFGEDWNDTLYALAKIESRFRNDSKIEYGNSLTW
jgi:hypothetical protein